MAEQEVAKYQVEHLILLVGGNPLPNAVAAQLLARPNATIWLLYSDGADGTPTTQKTADNLETFLRQRGTSWSIRQEPIPSADSLGIEGRVKEILEQNKINGRIGLHYTGGTKSMAVHTYRALEQVLANNHPRTIYSYLDPRLLALRIDGHGTESSHIIPVLKQAGLREQLQMLPDKLAALHGYERVKLSDNWARPKDTVGLLELCQAIALLNSTSKGHEAWKKWVYKEQHKVLPTPSQNPGFETVTDAFEKLCGGRPATPDTVAAKLLPDKPNARLTSCQDWFRGHWLEEYVLWCVQQTKSATIHHSEKGLKYKSTSPTNNSRDDFELDVVALMGYQLFVMSCITSSDRDAVKEHLLEAYVRAHQLGGDEARVAVVCCYDDTLRLQQEVSRSWDAEGKVRVFGRNELSQLTQGLADWFKQAS